jgi:hypothetical protein
MVVRSGFVSGHALGHAAEAVKNNHNAASAVKQQRLKPQKLCGVNGIAEAMP